MIFSDQPRNPRTISFAAASAAAPTEAIARNANVETPEDGVKSAPVSEDRLDETLHPGKKMVHGEPPSDELLDRPPAGPIDHLWPSMPKKSEKARNQPGLPN